FTLTRTYKATDDCGNFATCTQTLTVNDTNRPSLTCPRSITVDCPANIPPPDPDRIPATENCADSVTVSWQGDVMSSSNCPGQFVLVRTYRTIDDCGNFATCTQTITVSDTINPRVTCPDFVAVPCAAAAPPPDISSVIVSDNCAGPPTVTWEGDALSTSNCPNQFILTRTYKATDRCGNSATCLQLIIINDTNSPI